MGLPPRTLRRRVDQAGHGMRYEADFRTPERWHDKLTAAAR